MPSERECSQMPLQSAIWAQGKEDCSCLFLECPFAWAIWATQKISWVDIKSEEAFWCSLKGGIYRRHMEGRLFAVLWAIW